MAETRREFSVVGAHRYDQRSSARWIWSHLRRYPAVLSALIGGSLLANTRALSAALLTGAAFDEVTSADPDRGRLVTLVVILAVAVLVQNAMDLFAAFASEILAKRFQRDARDELFTSLLGKSQTFHNRQRVGDIMARATIRHADRIVVLERGRIVEKGSHGGLLVRGGHYAHIFNTYFRHQSPDYRPGEGYARADERLIAAAE